MRQLCTGTHSRNQGKATATQRSDHNRYLRKPLARVNAERAQAQQGLKATPSRLRQLESHAQAVAARAKVDGVWLGLPLFLEVRISLRAVCRVLRLLAPELGIKQAPCPQTVITWGRRLSIVRLAAARGRRGFPLRHAPFSHGLLWRIELSIGLGSGKIVAVLALDAHHHHLVNGAPSLHHAHGIAVAVADAWPGAALAEGLKRLSAQRGRPAADLKDCGSARPKAADL
jgi:hypothetical protein